ncbi:hypothetical protein P152DRAFT_437170 [Eremomyces bilateralis CBS 781.70]|uniref:tRNA (adenine(58)-N(1))-methyltransferase non-catalytic subunit TRM6 n=1 Tax=Eremomyces bilateralis CBS 781.70 TaxID=1392243 RepID=A0A6G1G211_9PEZI|nr:uncharacterized protein P152DRAFT_437170 [Eremomyces bilateralis CBS 781.70]KAF1812094.1 hypothetical protein P152DRAFT_437170 [Eremomyces bilateralis CBS 781.70]
MNSCIEPDTYVILRLPSEQLRIVEVKPDTLITIPKLGSFPTNLIIGRPFHFTYELHERRPDEPFSRLRVVPANELHGDALSSRDDAPDGVDDGSDEPETGAQFDIVADDGSVLMRNNRLTVDDASRQHLTHEEIEELKKVGTGSGIELIKTIMASHAALGEKTEFSLAKYTLRKSRKYLKRFTILPLDVTNLAESILEREAPKIMELREETVALACAWSNAHWSEGTGEEMTGRWLVIDDSGGLVVAALAERMGILYEDKTVELEDGDDGAPNEADANPDYTADTTRGTEPNEQQPNEANPAGETPNGHSTPRKPPRPRPDGLPLNRSHPAAMSATTNTLTLLHPNHQPNIGLLQYFGYDNSAPVSSHPLYTHLRTVSWLQLLHPSEDPTYIEPDVVSEDTLAAMKSGKRGNYYRKRRRWQRVKAVVDETRGGGFDGLVVASFTDPKEILKHTVPLLSGGAKVVMYSPNVEPLTEVVDLYSKERKAAYLELKREPETKTTQNGGHPESHDDDAEKEMDADFPVDPMLLLAPTLQTVRVRDWQVLPGRTHPMMTSRGGAEGYVLTATRVIPHSGAVEARGNASKRRKTEASAGPSEVDSDAGIEARAKRGKLETGSEMEVEV